RDGRVQLRAPRVDNNSEIAIDIESGAVINGAEAVVAEGVAIYDSTTLDSALLATALGDADAFMVNSSAIAARLGSGVSVRPGIGVRSSGDLTITDDIDLSNVPYGADALNHAACETGPV